jgi:hypothetical protein
VSVRDCEVLVSVARVRKLVALPFITQSERIAPVNAPFS